jgi:GT2 family glycosyltransferase
MSLSAIVPVRDGAEYLRQTLPALIAALPAGSELIVCDDGSRDGSVALAASLGARVIGSPESRGPAAARNRGARAASGELLGFFDADVRVRPDTLERLLSAMQDPSVAAAFGSYDAEPPARSWVSLYKNLAHHFVHQRSNEEAATFWAGCGVVRREAFLAASGFDESYRRPSIEDVELGYRLRAAGHRIRLVREAQATHLKAWDLVSWLSSDLRDRAIPWARLIRAGRGLPADLNFRTRDRAASALLGMGALAALLTPVAPQALLATALGVGASTALDLPLLAFLARRVSLPFGAVAALFQLLHRAAGLVGLAIGWLAPETRHQETTDAKHQGSL